MEPVSAKSSNDVLGGTFVDNIGGSQQDGRIKVCCADVENSIKNGILCTVIFKIKEGVSGETIISLQNDDESTFDENLEDINISGSEISVTIVASSEDIPPTGEPTATPSSKPTETPTNEPTAAPSSKPTATPTNVPAPIPTEKPTITPSNSSDKNISITNTSNKKVLKTIKLKKVKLKGKKLSGSLNISKAKVYVKLPGKGYKKAKVTAKKFSFTVKTKSMVTVKIKVVKKGYKTLIKSYIV